MHRVNTTRPDHLLCHRPPCELTAFEPKGLPLPPGTTSNHDHERVRVTTSACKNLCRHWRYRVQRGMPFLCARRTKAAGNDKPVSGHRENHPASGPAKLMAAPQPTGVPEAVTKARVLAKPSSAYHCASSSPEPGQLSTCDCGVLTRDERPRLPSSGGPTPTT